MSCKNTDLENGNISTTLQINDDNNDSKTDKKVLTVGQEEEEEEEEEEENVNKNNLKMHQIDVNMKDCDAVKNANENVLLSANGRTLSANNKHSFSVKDVKNKTVIKNTEIISLHECNEFELFPVMKNVEEKANIDHTKFIEYGKKENYEDINTINISEINELKESVLTNNENEKNSVKKIGLNDEKRLKKEIERDNKFKSKTHKWTEFTNWIDSLIVENDDSNNDKNKTENKVHNVDVSLNGNNTERAHAERTPNLRTYDVIVDGANVGYYKQNFNGAPTHIDYRQVDWMVKQLSCRGELTNYR